MRDSEFTIPPIKRPVIANTHAVVESIAQAQKDSTGAILNRLDRLIALQEKQNELLEQVAQGLKSVR